MMTMKQVGTKLDHLKQIEQKYHDQVLGTHVSIDRQKEKKFITFPYPYMNGRLHLGHGYSVLNAEMQSRYYASRGYNVLFPFAFHGSGMPIVACAKKLERELASGGEATKDGQIQILIDMGIEYENLHKFIDPTYWIIYFSQVAKEDLKKFQISADFSRSFYTTDMNPYYDSFIKWQFHHLMKKGYVYEGTRNVIYSELDKQPCADHDRHTGEGVKPAERYVKFVPIWEENVTIMMSITNEHYETDKVITGIKGTYVKFKFVKSHPYISEGHPEYCVCSAQAFSNIKNQCNVDTNEITEVYYDKLNIPDINWVDDKLTNWGTGFYAMDNPNLHHPNESIESIEPNAEWIDFIYDEPGNVVMSRSGDKCIVARTKQWFINYGDDELKKSIRQHVENMNIQDKHLLHQLFYAINRLEEWPLSRNFGLGTTIPGTNDLIDSLSDSTIYMAYYTISHLVTKIPKEFLNNDFWDWIFLSTDDSLFNTDNEIVANISKEMRDEFRYWYPVDIRVSGKDLITNHLTMCLFNHKMIWNGLMPENYFVNGYLLLDENKMSKHTGNFLTIDDTICKFGINATRLTLAKNDGMDDGNFKKSDADANVRMLYTELEWLTEILKSSSVLSSPVTMWDKIFDTEITTIAIDANNAYMCAKYNAVVVCLCKLINAKDEYCNMINKLYGKEFISLRLILKYCWTFISVMRPMCPSYVMEMIGIINDSVNLDVFDVDLDKFIEPSCEYDDGIICKYMKDIIKSVSSECFSMISKLNHKNITDYIVDIQLVSNFSEEEMSIINHIDDIDEFLKTIDKKNIGNYKRFLSYVNHMIEKYGKVWIRWVLHGDIIKNELTILTEYLPKIINTVHNVPHERFSIHYIESPEKYQFRHNPGNPKISVRAEKV